MSNPRIIKKYGNRRLYDTRDSRYVNLEDVANMVRDGEDLQVVDAKTGDDLTRHVLTQIIVEGSKSRDGGGLPLEFLRDLVKSTDRAHKDFLQWYLGTAAEAYQKVQDTLGSQPRWPTLQEQRAAWQKMFDPARIFDPLGAVRSMMRPDRERGEEAPEEPQPEPEAESSEEEPASAPVDELADLRQRLEDLESRLKD